MIGRRNHRPSGRRAGSLLRPGAIAVLSVALAAGGCTSLGDVHLAPVYTRVAAAGGLVETEWLGGLYRRTYQAEEDGSAGHVERTTVGPLWSYTRVSDTAWQRQWLVPLGFGWGNETSTTSLTLPLYWWNHRKNDDGSTAWSWLSLPGWRVQSHSEKGTQFAWLPLWGNLRDYLTYDRIFFVLFPLFAYGERADAVSYHFLYPVFGWTRGGGERSHHVWPLFGRSSVEKRYDRSYFLWPIFHINRNFLGGGDEVPETSWMVWPLFGRSVRGSYESTSWLWPFFGYASNPETGFWALDFPFWLIRLQHGPDDIRRTRFWPIWSRFEGEGLISRIFLWPIFHRRSEKYVDAKRESFYVIPFWRSWDRVDLKTGTETTWRKLWPVFRRFQHGDKVAGSFLDLTPLHRGELLDRHYGWLWKIYEWEASDTVRRERSLAGLWRREKDSGEDRKSFMGLWSSRKYAEEGRRVRETSLLFGLLRWRHTEGEGRDLLPVSFPGPGWPALRIPPDPVEASAATSPDPDTEIPESPES